MATRKKRKVRIAKVRLPETPYKNIKILKPKKQSEPKKAPRPKKSEQDYQIIKIKKPANARHAKGKPLNPKVAQRVKEGKGYAKKEFQKKAEQGGLTKKQRTKLNRLNRALRKAHEANPTEELIQVDLAEANARKREEGGKVSGLWRGMRYAIRRALGIDPSGQVDSLVDYLESEVRDVKGAKMEKTIKWLSNPFNKYRVAHWAAQDVYNIAYNVVNGKYSANIGDLMALKVLNEGKEGIRDVLNKAGIRNLSDLTR